MAAKQTTTQRYGSTVTSVDPAQGLVEVVLKTGETRQIGVYSVPPAFRWPRVGEAWMVQQQNGTWYLEGLYPNTSATTDFHDVNPGDLVLNTPTGVVHVIGGTGTNGFTLTQHSGPPVLSFQGSLDITILGVTTTIPTTTFVTL